jgi:hypothetical protein
MQRHGRSLRPQHICDVLYLTTVSRRVMLDCSRKEQQLLRHTYAIPETRLQVLLQVLRKSICERIVES